MCKKVLTIDQEIAPLVPQPLLGVALPKPNQNINLYVCVYIFL